MGALNRRQFLQSGLALASLGLLSGCGIPIPGQPPPKVARIGRLSPTSTAVDRELAEAFRQGLRDLGWVEGQNIAIEYRWADGQLDRPPDLAAELVRLEVDVIVAGSNPAIQAVKNATGTIPIVMVTTSDPVASGLVAGLAWPGGNVTGVTVLNLELGGKQLQQLKETVPTVTRVALVFNSDNTPHVVAARTILSQAPALGVTLQSLDVRTPGDLDGAFAAMSTGGSGALLMLSDPVFNTHRGLIVELAARNRVPAMYGLREFVDAGGLMFYGASLAGAFRHAATYVDKILKGTKPADLPVEQPTKFEFVINLKTARDLGLTIPESILMQATEVIQ